MKINKQYKLSKIVSRDEIREELRYVKITRSHAIATNGHKMVVVPVEMELEDVPGLVDPAHIEFNNKEKLISKKIDRNLVLNPFTVETTNGWTMPRLQPGTFPKIKQILSLLLRRKHKYSIGLNARLLYELSQGIGNDSVVLYFGEKNTMPILVKPLYDDDNEIGVLMPMNITR